MEDIMKRIICLLILFLLLFSPVSAATTAVNASPYPAKPKYTNITETAQLIRNLSIEHAFVFWGDQEVEHIQGENTSFYIPDIAILRGSTLLHNHPEGCINGFSYQDLKLATMGHVDTMIVTTQCGMWETKKPYKVWNYTEWK
jgi:hypothetical protein